MVDICVSFGIEMSVSSKLSLLKSWVLLKVCVLYCNNIVFWFNLLLQLQFVYVYL